MKYLLLVLILVLAFRVNANCENIIELNANNFQEEVLECKTLVIVDLWASWCKPCKQMSLILERLQEFHKSKIKIVKLDVDHNKKFLDNFRPLWGLPTLVFYKDGKEVDRIVGLLPFLSVNDKIMLLLKEEKIEKKEKEKKKNGCDNGSCLPPE